MASTSCITSTVRSINNELSPDPYLLASKAPKHLRPLSNDYGLRRLSLPPLAMPAQPSRRPPPVPAAAASRSRSHTNLSAFSPPQGLRTWSSTNFVDHFMFQNSGLLPPSLSSTPTTTSCSPHNNRPLSYQPTASEFKSRQQSTSSNQQHYYPPPPRRQFGLRQTLPVDVTAPVYGRGFEFLADLRKVQDKPEHIQDHVPRRRIRVPPRLSERKLGSSSATFEATQRSALVDAMEVFTSTGAVGAGSYNDLGDKDSGSGIPGSSRYGSNYYHNHSPRDEKELDGENMEAAVVVPTGDRRRGSVYGWDGEPEDYDCTMESEEQELVARGLKKISAGEYDKDISSLMWMAFDE